MGGNIAADRTLPSSYAMQSLRGGSAPLIRLSRICRALPVSMAPSQSRGPLSGDDNRDDSYDSRLFGFVRREEIVGRARFVRCRSILPVTACRVQAGGDCAALAPVRRRPDGAQHQRRTHPSVMVGPRMTAKAMVMAAPATTSDR